MHSRELRYRTGFASFHLSPILMTYEETYKHLQKLYDPLAPVISVPGSDLAIYHEKFFSQWWEMLPGAKEYRCAEHDIVFQEDLEARQRTIAAPYPESLKHDDIEIVENKEFSYVVFRKADPRRSTGVILMFHGLNEHYWFKYLPWAKKLVELTGKAVVLFPIAFHMNRTPPAWSNSRSMNVVTTTRRAQSEAIMNSSFANAAISARLEMIPQRFFWSGAQTFDDVVRLVSGIRSGSNPLIAAGSSIDIFAYSIGSFLAEILLMANPDDLFTASRLFMFCGGPTLDRMSPSSKFILDSDATIAIYSFYSERLESELRHDRRIEHFFSEHPAGIMFKVMLSYQKNKEVREKRFRELQNQIYAIALKKDEVIPPSEVLNILKGDYRDIGVPVEVLDFPFPYDHITPFPLDQKNEWLVDEAFNSVFNKAASFFLTP